MDVDTLVNRVISAIEEAKAVNIEALRMTSTIEDVKYIQGMLATMDDMKARLIQERKKLTRETLIDDDE
jgi:hypothetical protein